MMEVFWKQQKKMGIKMDEPKKIEFVPVPEQIAFAEAYIQHKGKISAACAQIGDPNRNFYYNKPNGWRYQEGFEEWLSNYAKQSVLKRIGKWYLILEKYAEAGSFQHINMLLQLGKEFCPKEMTINNTILNKVEDGKFTEATGNFLRFIADANRVRDLPEAK